MKYSTVRNIDFDQLDLWLFVAGELEVVTSRDIFQKEANCQLNILKDIVCCWLLQMVSCKKTVCSNSNRGGDGH